MVKARGGPSRLEPETIEMLAVDEVTKLRQQHAQLGEMLAKYDADRSPFDRVSYHVRRHLPLYALVAIFALIVVLVPTRNSNNQSASDLTPGGESSEFDEFTDANTPGGAKTKGDSASGADLPGGGGGDGPAGNVTGPGGPSKVLVGQGTTVGGFACKAGVRQLPWSTYANPCVAKFTGNNGGTTYRGVDAKTIKIAVRKVAVDAANITDEAARAQGNATRAEGLTIIKKWAGYFNKTFELYGRQVEFVEFQSRASNGIEEAQSRGQEGACADATDLAETIKAFAVVFYASGGGMAETQPFAECASERKLFVPFGASYFPELYYRNWHPYVFHVLQECERISKDVAEYVGKRLLNRKAKWALDPAYKAQNRVFGTYVPDNDGYQRCVKMFEDKLGKEYSGKVKTRWNYVLDVTRFPEQARQAVLKFKSDGITTLVNACDTLSTQFLTEAADDLDWGPEWFIIGVANQDSNGPARTWRQAVVNGHLFGMSQVGPTAKIEGKSGESFDSWKRAFPNQEPPRGYGLIYYRTLALFMMLQAAGPILTPANIAKGLAAMPEAGGAKGAYGRWAFKGDHTAVDDSREIYWDLSKPGSDGKAGTYIETMGGRRFKTGEWPKGEPPVYPK